MPAPIRRRRFRYSLRTIFVAMAVVAIFVAYHVNWIRQRREFLKIEDVWDFSGGFRGRPPAPGLLWMFGEKGIQHLVIGQSSDADLSVAESLFPEANRTRGVPVFVDRILMPDMNPLVHGEKSHAH